MAPIWQPQSWEVLQQWVDDILSEASDQLNDWETNFVDNMQDKILKRWELTRAQHDKLESIYAKYTS